MGETLEDLLAIWYHWTAAQRPHLGSPRCSPMFRYTQSGITREDGTDVDEREARIARLKAQAMDSLIDKLPRWEHRVAVELHVANRVGPRVWRNSRLTPEQLAVFWEEARAKLAAGCIDAGLLEEADIGAPSWLPLANREIRQ